jgi:hypothetical protein
MASQPSPGSTASTGSTLAVTREGFKGFRPLPGDGGEPTLATPPTPADGNLLVQERCIVARRYPTRNDAGKN